MKKQLVIFLLSILSLPSFAQENHEPIVYKYIVAEVTGQFLFTKCRVYIDDGTLNNKQEYKKHKKAYTFETHAAAIDYFTYHGWELVGNNNVMTGARGNSSTSIYWILRKPATKEEIEKILEKSVIDEDKFEDDVFEQSK